MHQIYLIIKIVLGLNIRDQRSCHDGPNLPVHRISSFRCRRRGELETSDGLGYKVYRVEGLGFLRVWGLRGL